MVIVKSYSASEGPDLNWDKIFRIESVNALLTMRICRQKMCILALVGNESITFFNFEMDMSLCDHIISELKVLYDHDEIQLPGSCKARKDCLIPDLDNYIQTKRSIICELPRMIAVEGDISLPAQFSAYTTTMRRDRQTSSVLVEDDNHLRSEASEIIAFVATNSDRISKHGIPPHLPIAYGLRGHSMSMEVMRAMLHDIYLELDSRNIGILCEVYDGQFHNIIVRGEHNSPLTRLQFQYDLFRKTMRTKTRQELIEHLLQYSEVFPDDVDTIYGSNFEDNAEIDMESLNITMHKRHNMKVLTVSSIPIDGVSFSDFRTIYRPTLWKKLAEMRQNEQLRRRTDNMTTEEMQNLIRGSKLHRRISSQLNVSRDNLDSSSDDDDDPDYEPLSDDISEEYEDDSIALNLSNISLSSNISVCSTGESCISSILRKLKLLKPNKHKWNTHNIDSFIQQFLCDRKSVGKLFMYEMDVINVAIKEFYHKEIFSKKDNKKTRIDKMITQLRKIPNLINYDAISEEGTTNNILALKDMCKKILLQGGYPKDYLAASYCVTVHRDRIKEWEAKSNIPINISSESGDIQHIVFNYPDFSSSRQKIIIRTFDYTHILNNLRFHICNRGFQGVSPEAFIEVSQINNDVLPRAIVEDKLDRQNCSISQRFFSEEVEDILRRNGRLSEATFVNRTRNWFNACDQRGMSVIDRLGKLTSMYQYLLSMNSFSEYPPPTQYVWGIPIRTYEALLHTINTRFILYTCSVTGTYNTRSISTLAIESFFSDLNRFEFSGLGAPKSVDIPKLISHIVHVNTVKHNPDRGFEFVTSTRDNYPCYLMENIGDEVSEQFTDHLFDQIPTRRKTQKKLVTLSKPKSITKGGRGIRQYLRIDETKLTHEQRLGRKISTDELFD